MKNDLEKTLSDKQCSDAFVVFGRAQIIMFCLAAIAALSLFLSLYIRHVIKPWIFSYRYVATPCVVTHHEIKKKTEDDQLWYDAGIEFDYIYEGERYFSNRFDYFSGAPDTSIHPARRRLIKYPLNSIQTCYVDPMNPGYAILERKLGFGIIGFLGPLFFIVVCVIVIWKNLFPSKPKPSPESKQIKTTPITD